MDAELKKNFCQCNCGQLCRNKFVHGHNSRGKPGWSAGLTKETHSGLRATSDKQKGRVAIQKGKTWEELYGAEKALEMKENHKKNYQQNFHSSESRKKAQANTIIWNTGLTKNQMPETMYSAERNAKVGRKGNSNGFKKGESSWSKGLTAETSASVAKMVKHNKGSKYSLETKALQSKLGLARWQDPEYRERMLPKICKVSYPNKKEIYLLDILNQIFPNDWIFSGHEDMLVHGKKPDFQHKTKNLLIEMFGCYFHSCKKCELNFKDEKESGEDRTKYFKKFNYECLIIWEHELKDFETLKTKIISFVGPN